MDGWPSAIDWRPLLDQKKKTANTHDRIRHNE
jgi:hypothetical protein